MSKIRIYDLARRLGQSNNRLVEMLQELGVKVKSHSSTIDEEAAALVERELGRASGPMESEAAAPEPVELVGTLEVEPRATVGDIAKAAGKSPADLVKALIGKGFMIPANSVPDDGALLAISEALGTEVVRVEGASSKKAAPEPEAEAADQTVRPAAQQPSQPKAEPHRGKKHEKEKKHAAKAAAAAAKMGTPGAPAADKKPRPPIVTVMGHVDHGKTTLLDFIRKTRVTEGEAGGITQHIGAYKVNWGGKDIVFLDTPGHEAFTAMRARGAGVTDIAVLVVAADDGVKPQTLEAMNHAKAAGVPVVVAVNKIDKPEAKPDRVRQQLSDYGLVPEEWGGDTVMVDVAAKTGDGIDQLLEMVLLVAEMEELSASDSVPAEGVVVEANLDKGKGPVATIIVQQGTLKRGMIVVTQTAWGKVRAMLDDTGRPIEAAGPSTPVEILGLEAVPMPGETFRIVPSEREARDAAGVNTKPDAEGAKPRSKLTLEELYDQMQTVDTPQLNIVLKCDVQGSLEAFRSTIMKMSTDAVRINIIHDAVGRISESDVTLASVSNAIIIGFNVRPDANAKKMSEADNVQIRLYRVIYDMQDDIKAALEGMLAPTLRENTLGQAEIRQIFKVPKVGRVAGCYVQDGSIKRNSKVRVIREGVVAWEGSLSSLRHFKDEVREIANGNECGMSFAGFQDFREGDVVECYEVLSEKQKLDI